MNSYQIVTQIVGAVASLMVVLSFQIKRPRYTFAVMGISLGLFAVHYAMLGSACGVMQNTLSLIRNIVIMTLPKESRAGKIAKCIVLFLFGAAPFIELAVPALPFSPWDFLIAPATLLGSALFWTSDVKKIRIGQFFLLSPAWLTYAIVFGSVPGIVTECFNMLSVAVSWIRINADAKKKVK